MPNVNPAPLAGLPTGNAPMSPPPPVNPIKLTSPARMISPAGANIGTPPPATPQLLTEKLARVSKRIQSETGYTIRPNTKTRTPEEQAKLYAQGRTAPGKVVTNADGTKKKSEHQEGLAADLTVFDKNGKKVDSKKVWDMIGKIAEEEGLTWGGRWKSPYDPGHVQLNPVK
jgi:peptidoglycan L-alanyl-D-glutamate endopeptidase CwlK